MSNIVDLNNLNHRSKERIKNLGEVFTPEAYVEDMLDLLSKDKKNLWSNEDIAFFEPCSGHGNFVLSIYKRRLEAIYKKAVSQGNKDAAYYAVANSLNTLWAIDIDKKNIENCRTRVLSATIEFLKLKTAYKDEKTLLSKKKDFFAHVLSAITWHIEENETLSALSNPQSAKVNAGLTKAGAKWFSINGHQQLNFELTWVHYFEQCESANTTPIEYQRSLKFIEASIYGKTRGFDEFDFAKALLDDNQKQPRLGA